MSADSFEASLGLVGVGYWGPNHLRVIEDSARAELKWVCDSNQERLDRVSPRTRATTTTELDRVLEDPDTDALIIATPMSTHFEIGMRALEAGKHLMIEKPLAGSSAEADALLSLAADKGLAVMCGHTFLFSPPVVAIREMLRQGDLGEIYFVSSSRVNLGLHQRDNSVLWDLAPHDFSILLDWFDEKPESVSAVGRDSIVPGIADVAFVDLGYESGLIANVELSWLAPSKLRRTTVVGSEKMVVYDDAAPEQVRVYDHGVVFEDPGTFGQYHLSYRTGDILTPKLPTTEPISAQLDAFLDAVSAGRAPQKYTRIARDVVELIEMAERSLENEGVRSTLTKQLPAGLR